jgi:hypothetical protein
MAAVPAIVQEALPIPRPDELADDHRPSVTRQDVLNIEFDGFG